MTTYLVLNLAFLAVIAAGCALVLLWARPSAAQRRELGRPLRRAGVALLAMTAVFDSLIVASGIVAYDEALILGVRIGSAPIEDFAYALAALMIAPTAWIAMSPHPPARTAVAQEEAA